MVFKAQSLINRYDLLQYEDYRAYQHCLFLFQFLSLQATLRTSIPGLVGGTQRINLGYQVMDTSVSNHLNDMNLIMKILPEAAWEALGKPPPSEVDFVSSVPQAQDIQFSLNYGQTKVRLLLYFP